MNREIKFRAWDDGKMVYFKDISHLYLEDYEVLRLAKFFCNIRNDSMIMQFTGLKDKNGKDIYEGDVMNYKRTGDNWAETPSFDKDYQITVGFKEGSFACEETDRPLHDYIRNVSYNPNNWTKWEVIGNIYENHELINSDPNDAQRTES